MKICQALFVALFVVQCVYGGTTTRSRLDRSPTGTKDPNRSTRDRGTFTGTKDPNRSSRKPIFTGTKDPNRSTKDPNRSTRDRGTFTGRPKPTGSYVTKPTKPKRPSDADRCQAAKPEPESLGAKFCCFRGLLTGPTNCPDGEKDKRPDRCEDGDRSTRAPNDRSTPAPNDRSTPAPKDRSTPAPKDRSTPASGGGAKVKEVTGILKEFRDQLDCRRIPEKDAPSKPDEKKEKDKEDPRRDDKRISDKANKLSAQGKKCVDNLKLAIEAVKTLVDQWKGSPTSRPRRDAAKLRDDTVAETFYDSADVAVQVEQVSSDFDQNNIDETAKDLLPENEGDDDDSKPKQCRAAWQMYKDELGQLIKKFKKLPQMFKDAKIKTVVIALKDIDMGAVNWEDAKSVCRFAQAFVTKMKEARESLGKRLRLIRNLICKDGAALATGGKPGMLAKCFRQARKGNQTKGDRDANDKVYKRIRGKTNKIFGQIRRMCVATSKAGGQERIPSSKTMRRIKMKIKNTCKDQDKVAECRAAIVAKIRDAIKAANPDAQVDVTVDDAAAATTTLAARRRLSALGADVIITQEGAQANPDYESAVNSALNEDVEVTSDTTESEDIISPPADIEDVSEIPPIPTDTDTPTTVLPQVDAGTVAQLAAGVIAGAVLTVL